MGDRIGDLDEGGSQRRKSMVLRGNACLSIDIQSGLNPPEFTIENCDNWAAW